MMSVPSVDPTVFAATALVCLVAYAAIYWDLKSHLTPAGNRVVIGVFLLMLALPSVLWAQPIMDPCSYLQPYSAMWWIAGCFL